MVSKNEKNRAVSKAEAIRQIAKNDPSITNRELKNAVQRQYGLSVGSNQITNELGRYADRRFCGRSGLRQLQLAKEFVAKVGDLRHAVRLLHLSQSGGNQ